MTEPTGPVLGTVGNYDLLEKIAEGGMGTVYKARDRATGQTVAIKVAPAHVAKSPVLRKRFELEYSVARSLEHPNLVRALSYGFEGPCPYLVLEYVEGESLGKKIERDGRMSETEAIRLIAQVAQGLRKAHKQGIVHRDVKPDNVIVTPDGQAKLTDLGLVKEVEADLNLTRTGRGLGTPHFMAPEQFRAAKDAGPRADIYSLGATLYMMVTGQLPFGATTGPLDAWMRKVNNDLPAPRELVPSLSERVDWAIRRAMSPDKEQRPATCREFVEDLTGHSTRKIVPADPGTAQEYWYLIYTDEAGEVHTVKGTLGGIRRSLKEGRLGDGSNVRAGRSKAGPFEPLRTYPEFRDLLIAPAPLTPLPAKQSPAGTMPALQTDLTADPAAAPPPALGPLIPIAPTRPQSDWLKWVLLALIALATGVISFYLFPLVLGGKLP
jgi:eukaryotic-like serine/threonine-protein kinase